MADPDTLPPDPLAAESPRQERLHRIMHRREMTKDEVIWSFLLIALGSGVIAGFLVSAVVGFASTAFWSLLYAFVVWRIGADNDEIHG
jgi:hypothetical protein